jgi:hypothetical protein
MDTNETHHWLNATAPFSSAAGICSNFSHPNGLCCTTLLGDDATLAVGATITAKAKQINTTDPAKAHNVSDANEIA